MKRLFILTVLSTIFFQACVEDVNLDIVGGEQRIVIDGNIESGSVATVILTRNTPVSQQLDTSNLWVLGAKVYVSDGVTIDTLTALSEAPFIYIGNNITGASGKTYNLTIIADNKTFTASTFIPPPLQLDSVWWQPQPPYDTLGYAWARISEPAGIGDAYRWFTKTNSEELTYISPAGGVFDDKFIDGESFDFFNSKPTDPFIQPDSVITDEDKITGYFTMKDTVLVKFTTIDESTFRFFLTLESSTQSGGNPFGSSSNPTSNINNGDGLGIWAGYGVTLDTIFPSN